MSYSKTKFAIFCMLIICNWQPSFSQIRDMNALIPMDKSIRTGVLPNGMKYYIRKNNKPENRAEMRLAINAGSTAENDAQQGLAHLCEHMCFNGTKNFKKSELVDYLESIGTKFGAHLNAYTSFDETVYMLQLPTDKEEIVTKGLQILEDWAHNVTFDSIEIDKERGVAIEEWRLGQGAQERARRQYWPVLFKDSRYAVRLPIGKKEIIENFPQQVIKDFYNDWYRPDLMAIAVVGDFDLDKMVALVKERFSQVPAEKNPLPLKAWNVPDNETMMVAVAKDKEMTNTTIQVIYKQNTQTPGTYDNYRKGILNNLYSTMLSARYSELSKLAEPPFLYAAGGYSSLVRAKDGFNLVTVAKPDGGAKALEALLTEAERVQRFGFTPSELDRAKSEMLSDMERAYNERDKQESRALVGECVRNFLEGEAMAGIEREFELTKLFLNGITLEEMNGLSKEYFTDGKNEVVVITAPDKTETKVPTEDDVKSIMANVKKMDLTAYVDKVFDKPMLEKIPEPIKILAETKNEKFNITYWKLPNGASVSFKNTDFKNDEIRFQSFRFGGHSTSEDAKQRSAMVAAALINSSGLGELDANDIEKFMSGKNANASPYVSELTEGINGGCAPKDMELMFQMLYQYYMAPRKDEGMFKSMMAKQQASLQNKSVSPESNFRDTVSYVMSNYHPRAKPMTAERLKEINLDDAFNFYRQRFDGVNGLHFMFVGNIDEAKLRNFVERYIATLPAGNSKPEFVNLQMKAPEGNVERFIYKGSEPKSSVSLRITGKMENNRKNRVGINLMMRLLSIKLRESMREDKSGVYGVGANVSTSKYPNEGYDINISFGCSPDNVEMLIRAAIAEIELMKKNGASEIDITKVRETALRERESDLKENNFWLSAMYNQYYYGDDINDLDSYTEIVKAMDSNRYKELAIQYLKMDNFARFVLLPEKK